MTKEAIIEEIKKHPPEVQREIIAAVWESSEAEYELTDEEKALVDRRWKEMQEHPETIISYDELKKQLRALMKK